MVRQQQLPPPPLLWPQPSVTFHGFCWSSPSAFDVDATFVWMRQRLPPPPLPSPTPPRRPSPVTFCGFCWSSPSAFFDVDANFVWTTGAPFLLVLLHTLQLQLFFPLCWWRPTKQELLLESVFFVLLLLIEDFIYVVQRRLTKASSFFIDHDSFLLRSAGGGSLSDAVLMLSCWMIFFLLWRCPYLLVLLHLHALLPLQEVFKELMCWILHPQKLPDGWVGTVGLMDIVHIEFKVVVLVVQVQVQVQVNVVYSLVDEQIPWRKGSCTGCLCITCDKTDCRISVLAMLSCS